MTTISARIDDQLKSDADKIADSIGITLSAAITVFLKKFVSERGFPFEVKASAWPINPLTLSTDEISFLVKQSIQDPLSDPKVPPVTFIEPQTHQLVTEK